MKKDIVLKILLILVEGVAVLLLLYLVFLPIFPIIKYNFYYKNNLDNTRNIDVLKEEINQIRGGLPEADFSVSPDRLIIKKIGVNAPIVESFSSEYGLSRGAWLVPNTSTPDKGGNTVITGHRFKYLPPNNLTFYLFHKLEIGDVVSMIWHEQNYFYLIKEIKIVDPTELSVINPTEKPTLTMYTCHPIYSTEKRLVVIAELVE